MKLLVISTASETADQHDGDVIGIFPDDHEFSSNELAMFAVIEGVSQEDHDAAEARVPRYPLRWDGSGIAPNLPR